MEPEPWRILLVDDDEDDYLLTRSLLLQAKTRKIDIDWAATYEVAWQTIQNSDYDALLIDYNLGTSDHTGIDLIRAMTAANNPTPTLIFTGRGSYELDFEAMQAGATLYLAKDEANPFLLERAIRYAIERKQSEVALRAQSEAMQASERRQRELVEALQADRARLAAVLESLPVGVWIADQNGQLIGKNEAADQIWAGDAPLVERIDQYQTYVARYPGSDHILQPEEYPVARALQSEQPIKAIELEIRRLDGTTGTVLVSAAPIKDPQGRLTGAVGINVDITEHKQAQQSLQESEARYRELAQVLQVERNKLAAAIDNLPVGVGIGDAQGNTLSLNNAGLKLHGFASEAEMFSRLERCTQEFELRYPDGRVMPLEAWPVSRALNGEFVQDYEVCLRNLKAQSESILSYSVAPVRNPAGELTLIVYVIQDLTERKKSEETLRAQSDAFRNLADAMPQLVWTANPDGSVDYYNQRYSEYEGIAPSHEATWHWSPVLHPEDVQPTVEAWNRAIVTGEMYQVEHRVRVADGSYRWHLSRGVPARDKRGRIVKWYGTATDIHETRQAQEELRNFAYIASHDLQEPLRKITRFGEMLQRKLNGQITEEGADILSRMMGAASRMGEMIDRLLDLSRVNTQNIKFQPVDLARIAAETVDLLDSRIQQSGGQVHIAPLPTIEADPLQMQQLLQNLIGNALKFHQPGIAPIVNVSAEEVPGAANCTTLRVEDNGIGFDPQYAEQIFQPFRRLHGRSEYEGTGMGLAICQRIVERHKGSITVTSQPGEGSTFTVTLPKKAAA